MPPQFEGKRSSPMGVIISFTEKGGMRFGFPPQTTSLLRVRITSSRWANGGSSG